MLVSEIAGAEVMTIKNERGEQFRRSAAEIDHGSFAEPRLADAEERPVELHGKRGVRRFLERDDPTDEGDARVALRQTKRPLRKKDGELMRGVQGRKHKALELDPVAEHCDYIRQHERKRH